MPKTQALKSTKSYTSKSVSARRSLLFVVPKRASLRGKRGGLLSSDKGDPYLPGVCHISDVVSEAMTFILTHDNLNVPETGEVD